MPYTETTMIYETTGNIIHRVFRAANMVPVFFVATNEIVMYMCYTYSWVFCIYLARYFSIHASFCMILVEICALNVC